MGRGGDELATRLVRKGSVRASSGIEFHPRPKKNIGKRELRYIMKRLGKRLDDVRQRYGPKAEISEELENHILLLLEEFEGIEKESPRADEIREELGNITEKHFMQKIDFSSLYALEQLMRVLGRGNASKGSMHSQDAEREARMNNILQSQQGELREEALIEIAKGNKDILVAKTEIPGFGVDASELPGKDKRHIFHRIDPQILKEATLAFGQAIDEGEKDAAGFITERAFEKARRDTLRLYEKEMKASAKRRKDQFPERSSYDMIFKRDDELSVWEVKTSGHLGNKAGGGEYGRLLENTLLLSLTCPDKVAPYFGCLERDKRYHSSPQLPAGHSLVADNLLRGVLPDGLSWQDYMRMNPWTDDRSGEKEMRWGLVNGSIAFAGKVELMSEEEKAARLNAKRDNFKNSFLGE